MHFLDKFIQTSVESLDRNIDEFLTLSLLNHIVDLFTQMSHVLLSFRRIFDVPLLYKRYRYLEVVLLVLDLAQVGLYAEIVVDCVADL